MEAGERDCTDAAINMNGKSLTRLDAAGGEPTRLAPWRQWGEGLEAEAVRQMANACALPVAVAGALMPDAHVGYGLPIGGVLATDNAVIPYAVGVDNWRKLPVREHDNAVNTPRGPVLVPTVIVAVNYAKVPLRLPRF